MSYRQTLQARILRHLFERPAQTHALYLEETQPDDWEGFPPFEALDQAIRILEREPFDPAYLCEAVGEHSWNAIEHACTGAEPVEFVRHEMRELRKTTAHALLMSEFQRIAKSPAKLLDVSLRDLQEAVTDLTRMVATPDMDDGSIAEGVQDYLQELESPTVKARAFSGVPALDQLLGGWYGGQLIVLAARPKCGKTMLAHQVIAKVLDDDLSAVLFSLEMGKQEVAQRLITHRAGTPNLMDLSATREAGRALASQSLACYTKPTTADDVREAVARESDRGKVGLVVVDYLGLLKGHPRQTEYERVTEASLELKRIAQEFDVPVLAVHQLNRVAASEEPRAHHLRSSGQIEADADQVVLLWRDGDEDDPNPIVKAKLELARQRAQGGSVELCANFPGMRFEAV